jgi:ferric-dicitrate binding protein FerR (iron transport regulator)
MQDIEELMQLAVDGVATSEQSAELQRVLASSPEVRAKFEGLQSLVTKLDSVPLVDAPPVIRWWKKDDSRGRLSSTRRTRFWFAVAYAAAAMLIVVLAVRHAMVSGRSSAASMVAIQEQWPVIAEKDGVTVRSNGDEIVVESSIAFSINYDHSKLEQIDAAHYRRLASGPTTLKVILLSPQHHREFDVPIELR